VKNCTRKHETVAYDQYYDFHLLRSEVDPWNRGEESLEDRKRPIKERRRYYTLSPYTEPRLCRYRATMRWPATVSFRFNAGYVARESASTLFICPFWIDFVQDFLRTARRGRFPERSSKSSNMSLRKRGSRLAEESI
jgi:hypothetical protein